VLDETEEHGPQMSLVSGAAASAGTTERLARARSSPHRTLVRPTGEPESMTPAADAGEEMTLREAVEIGWANIADVSLVDDSGNNDICRDEFA
jgi:hypothetical protein